MACAAAVNQGNSRQFSRIVLAPGISGRNRREIRSISEMSLETGRSEQGRSALSRIHRWNGIKAISRRT
jgi:hypothetical protein